LITLILSQGLSTSPINAEVGDLGPEIVGLSAYGNMTCMNSKDGEVWCWGQSPSLGTGRDTQNATPHKVYEVKDSIKVEVGGEFSCSLGKSGTIKCWGKNNLGQAGNATLDFKNVYFPEYVALAIKNVDLALGESHGCSLSDIGEVWCWGDNKFGQLGNVTRPTSNVVQTPNFSSIPSKVNLSSKVKAIDSGSFHTCAISYEDLVYCWGANFNGQLGIGMTGISISAPRIVPLLSKVDTLNAGYNSTCARSLGEFYCWGEGSDGQLGDLESFDRPLPRIMARTAVLSIKGNSIAVPIGSSISSVTLGLKGACGIERSTGTNSLICWGTNSGYEPVSAITGNVVLGFLHGCHITVSKTVNCWGSQQYGQTGQGVNSGTFVASTIVSGIPEWRNYINSWKVVYKNDIAAISWTGAAQSKFVFYLEPFGLICETTVNFYCDVGPLESNKTYSGLIIARGATTANSRMAIISISTGTLLSAYDAQKESERKQLSEDAVAIEFEKAAKAMEIANAATDAANLAADAADAASIAAEEAQHAALVAATTVEQLSSQVETLIAELKAQTQVLSKTVAKLAEKVNR
jgi:alpha-tubulin suppressor-like RCC1 family protein